MTGNSLLFHKIGPGSHPPHINWASPLDTSVNRGGIFFCFIGLGCHFIDKKRRPDSDLRHFCNYLIIQTLEGQHIADINDYIICGIKGEFYPCKPEIFEETYELVVKDN